ncbi:MAG: glycosyltransferase family 4 protein [Candidatus Falkowbacteria bacterium]
MTIAFIGQKGIPATSGGVERYVEDLAVRIAARGVQAVVYTRPYYTAPGLTNYNGVKLVSLPSIKTKHLDAISHSFLAVVHAVWQRYDVIHFQSIGPALVIWLPRLLSPKTRIVSTLQSRDYEHQKWNGLSRWFLRLGEKFMCHFSHEVVVVTESMRDYVRAEYGLEALYIPNGANHYDAVGADELSAWSLEPGQYIAYIGRLVRHKGVHHLIAAYNQLSENKLPLVIVGDGAFTDRYVDELKALAGDSSKIIFTGRQSGSALAELYANARLFVQPSESEGLSLALLEAMSRGVPVLVSSISENLEAIGDTGFIFENKSVDDLREKLRFILSEPELAAEKTVAAKLRVASKFDWDEIAGAMLMSYRGQGGLVEREAAA